MSVRQLAQGTHFILNRAGYVPPDEWLHSPDCERPAELKAFAEWEQRWPDYCRDCNASGQGRYYPGTREDPPEQDPCDGCWEENRCPRCSIDFAAFMEAMEQLSAYVVCPNCGWQEAGTPSNSIGNPDLPPTIESPCSCELEDMAEEADAHARFLTYIDQQEE